MFDRYDKSGDGYITRDELAAVFRELTIPVTSRELHVLFNIIATDPSGRIEFDEFLDFFFGYQAPK
jgi:calmodulin